jgi:hypothetical protein
MGEQVALLTKRASKKIWVMRRMENLGLDGKKTISGFLKAEGQFFDIFFYLSKTAQ